ncbi:MAG: dephospho-CoA kinase [Lachnospiraceae bacterium]|jgi:dephospho-CoA kinase
MVIGITGGVGCGKSTVLNILKNGYDARVIIADDIARQLQEPGYGPYRRIVREFGKGILTAGKGSPIDRKVLADIVFSDTIKRERLNFLVHPAVKKEIKRLIRQYKRESSDALIVIEAALLIEAGYRDILDEIWAVTASYRVRLERLALSRGYSKEKTDSIMATQKSDGEFIKEADYHIDNSGSIDDTRLQIEKRLGPPPSGSAFHDS